METAQQQAQQQASFDALTQTSSDNLRALPVAINGTPLCSVEITKGPRYSLTSVPIESPLQRRGYSTTTTLHISLTNEYARLLGLDDEDEGLEGGADRAELDFEGGVSGDGGLLDEDEQSRPSSSRPSSASSTKGRLVFVRERAAARAPRRDH